MENSINPAKSFFSDDYARATQLYASQVQPQVEENEGHVHVPEKTIRCIWNDQLLSTQDLRTTDGKPIRIIFPGFWTFGTGPDFSGVIIQVDDKVLEGDAELHVYSSDWKAHKHSDNPDYDNVILHVFMWQDRWTAKGNPAKRSRRGEDGYPAENVYELELKDYLKHGILELNDRLDFDNYPTLNKFNLGYCHEPLSKLSKEKLVHLLNAAGDARIFTKMGRFHDRIIVKGYEQTFYEGIAEALGYPNNKIPFRTLAENLPLQTIWNCVPWNAEPEEKAVHIQALLFGVAGLIDFNFKDKKNLSASDEVYFSSLAKLWEHYQTRLPESTLQANHWSFSGIRPANYPYRRISALAHLLVRHEENGIFGDFLEEFHTRNPETGEQEFSMSAHSSKKVLNFFCIDSENDYWANHYVPGGKTLGGAQQLVGSERSREIAINIGIPVGLIFGRASKSISLEEAISVLYQSKKKPSDNKWTRFMKQYLFGNKEAMLSTLDTDKQVQGLMQIFQDYCTENENNCHRCQFPGVVEKFFS